MAKENTKRKRKSKGTGETKARHRGDRARNLYARQLSILPREMRLLAKHLLGYPFRKKRVKKDA